ncbi:MAG TPA: RNA polymerase subunit sigma, partial [Deltaproteobacteria bacterium]|nr:RNA polymerase subunit sigma [Deltaproteobacteria bacterium]
YQSLVQRYQGRVYAVAYGMMRNREDAREMAQEAFIKAYNSLPHFRRESSFYTWIYRITVNLCIDSQRKAYRAREIALDEQMLPSHISNQTGPTPILGPSQSYARKELRGHIKEAIDQLPDDQRRVIVLREVEGLSYKEIAESTGAAEGTVMSRLYYARKRLQELLKEVRS